MYLKFISMPILQVTLGLLLINGFTVKAVSSELLLAERAGGQSAIVSAEEKKPLVVAFENTVQGAKRNDWAAVEKSVGSVRKETNILDKTYGTGLMADINKTIVIRDAGQLLNLLANTVYLAMCEEFKLAANGDFKPQDKALEHVKAARQYYEKIFFMNISRKDAVLNSSILSAFEGAQKSIETGDESKYLNNIKVVEEGILKVYVKFADTNAKR